MMKKNKLEIKKIPLKDFIETLIDILNKDVDFVNMVVEKGDHQDNIRIIETVSEVEKESEVNKGNINFEELG